MLPKYWGDQLDSVMRRRRRVAVEKKEKKTSAFLFFFYRRNPVFRIYPAVHLVGHQASSTCGQKALLAH